jgi:hypothetical protein
VSRFGEAIRHAWNVFSNQTQTIEDRVYSGYFGTSSSARPDKPRIAFSNERSIISSIFTRISIDVASVDIRHVRTDDQRRFMEEIDSGLNNCLLLEANVDQAARQFRQDIIMTLCDQGVCALVPVDTSLIHSSLVVTIFLLCVLGRSQVGIRNMCELVSITRTRDIEKKLLYRRRR